MFCSVPMPSAIICALARLRMPLPSNIRMTEPSGPGLRNSRPRKRLVAMSRAGATASVWYTVSIPATRASMRLAELNRLAVEAHDALSGDLRAGQALDQRGFPGTVVADHGQHLAGERARSRRRRERPRVRRSSPDPSLSSIGVTDVASAVAVAVVSLMPVARRIH